MRHFRHIGLTIAIIFQTPVVKAAGPWDMEALAKPPKVEWVDKTGPVRQLYYEGEPYKGKPTRVFAWYAEPERAEGKSPAMVLVHGGGGTAFKEWAELWAKRGYVAIAMDLAGAGPDRTPLSDGGPGQGDDTKFPKQKIDLKDMWSYHAVANVIRANSLLRSLPNVDADRIGLTGISWGGYLTCIVAGLDNRFRAAVPVYGCGFLHENSVWLNRFAALPEEWRKEWVANFDPSSHVGNAKMPMLFVNGTNDFAYPLDSYQKTYRLVKNRQLCVTVNMPHGHPQGWAPAEIGLFIDSVVKNGKPLPKFAEPPYTVGEVNGDKVVTVRMPHRDSGEAIADVKFHWTTDTALPWQKRKWQTAAASAAREGDTSVFTVKLPKDAEFVWFLTATDGRKATVSTEHVTVGK